MTRIAAVLLFLTTLCFNLRSQPPGCSDTFIYSDVLFVVDNSGSISDAEYSSFQLIMEETVTKVRSNCPNANIGIVHYGGVRGDSTVIEYDFTTAPITTINRQFCISNPTSTCVSGDDLNFTIGNIMTFFTNGDLTLTPGNRLSIVIMTDAFGGELGPCDFDNCSAIRPYTNIDIMKLNYEANVLVVGVEPDADAIELAPYASPGGSYTGALDGGCAGTVDGCVTPRQYIPIQFADDVDMASDSIANSVQCQVIMVPGIGVSAGADTTICDDGSGVANLLATPIGGTAPFLYEWDNGLGFGPSKNVSPAVTTTYTVTITDANDCQETDQVTVVVQSCGPDCSDDFIYSDILFLVDNSGSITDAEYASFEAIMLSTMSKVQGSCPSANVAVVHYGGDLGDSTIIEHDFTNSPITNINRQFCVSNPFGTCVSGDDLNAAMGNIMNDFQNGSLNRTPINRLSVVVFTDAFGGEEGPCDFVNCSAIRPYTNAGLLKTNYSANILVIGIEPDADAEELAPVASIGGHYTGLMNGDCAGAVDGCTRPRQYIPIQFADDINMASDSIAKAVECTVIAIPKVAVNATGGTTICGNLGQTADISAEASIGPPPYTYEWSNALGFGPTKTVSPAVTTTYYVTATDANTCTAVDSVTIVVTVCDDCVADAGDPLPHRELCLQNGSAQLYTDENIGIVKPSGFEEVYILTDENLTILNYRIGKGYFTVNKTGLYRIHTLIAEVNNKNSPDFLDLGIIKKGSSNLFVIVNCIEQHGVCADFDFPGRVHIVLGPDDMMCMTFENSINLCSDGLDNDGDGLVDCADDDCHELINCLENTLLACNDLFDNDRDGLVDCYDSDCFQFTKCFERDEQCGDGLDNDGDGLVDCADSSCSGSYLCEEMSAFTCLDGKDNDGDGLIDCEEASCKKFLICAEFSVDACSDGVDNDYDGLVDCADRDCQQIYSQVCVWKEQSSDFCSDGIDNDGDGLIDCQDPDCGFSKLLSLQATIKDYIEITGTTCPNNDDGAIGFAMPSTGLSYVYSIDGATTFDANALFTNLLPGTYVLAVGISSDCYITTSVYVPEESCPEICDNGKDDDKDGLTDCDDPDCGLMLLSDPIISHATCPDNDNGSFLVSYASGTGTTSDVEYSLNGGPYKSLGYYNGLMPGIYNIAVRNAKGCQLQVEIEIHGDENPEINEIMVNQPVCPGLDDGSVMIVMQNMQVGYHYSINGGITFQPNPVFENLLPGQYNVVVVSDEGCLVTSQFMLEDQICIEICGNGIDDDGNGFSDCDDEACGFVKSGSYSWKNDKSHGQDATIVLSSADASINFGSEGYLLTQAWTDFANGSPEYDSRALVNFETNGAITQQNGHLRSAELKLYFRENYPFANGGRFGENAATVHIITGPWQETQVTWNNQPMYLETPYVEIPQNNDYTQLSVDVKPLLEKVREENTPFYGFLIKQSSEEPYRSMVFAAREYEDSTKTPELNVEFTTELNVVDATCLAPGIVQFEQGANDWEFSLDGINYQSSPVFDSVVAGIHTGYIVNAEGCMKVVDFEVVKPTCIEICDNGLDDDEDGLVDCMDDDCSMSIDSTNVPLIITDATCPFNDNGRLEVMFADSTYSYSINGNDYSYSAVFEGLIPGNYNLYVKNNSGCIDNDSFVIGGEDCIEICDNGIDDDGDGLTDCLDDACGIVLDSLPIGTIIIDATCPGNDNGGFEVINVENGYTYSIDGVNYQDQPVFVNLTPDNYILLIKNEFGCLTEMIVTIDGSPCVEVCDNGLDDDEDGLVDCMDDDCSMSIDSTNVPLIITDATCPFNDNGRLEVMFADSTYSYSINGNDYSYSGVFEGLIPGNYNLYVKNNSGCVDNDSFVIGGEDCIEICDNGIDDDGDGLTDCLDDACGIVLDSLPIGTIIIDATCPGNDNGGFEVINVENGYTYSIDGVNYQDQPVFVNLTPDNYILLIKNEFGCLTEMMVTIDGSPCVEVCDNGLDDDEDGLVDCNDGDCSGDIACNSVGVSSNLTVFLQGAYNPDQGIMSTELNENGYLPGQQPSTFFGTYTPPGQPYNAAPWFYEGDEKVKTSKSNNGGAQYDPEVVDWVLVSLRTEIARESEIWRGAGLLYSDGYVELLKEITLSAYEKEGYYVVIEHRNHLPVMSRSKTVVKEGTLNYDFTSEDSFNSLIGVGQVKLEDGTYAMIAGNGELIIELSSDIDINVRDFNCWLFGNGFNSSYFLEDYDMNGDVNIKDRIIWETNNGRFSTISTK